MKPKLFPIGLCIFLIAGPALAWWNEEWTSRREISVDADATGADIQGTVTDFPLLVRLHAGNFSYFGEVAENGKDLRFQKTMRRR